MNFPDPGPDPEGTLVVSPVGQTLCSSSLCDSSASLMAIHSFSFLRALLGKTWGTETNLWTSQRPGCGQCGGSGSERTYLHPGINVHQSSSGDRLHDSVIVSQNVLQLCVAVAIGGAEHQCAHDVGDGPGHRGRRVKAATPIGQQLSAQPVHGGQNWRERRQGGCCLFPLNSDL